MAIKINDRYQLPEEGEEWLPAARMVVEVLLAVVNGLLDGLYERTIIGEWCLEFLEETKERAEETATPKLDEDERVRILREHVESHRRLLTREEAAAMGLKIEEQLKRVNELTPRTATEMATFDNHELHVKAYLRAMGAKRCDCGARAVRGELHADWCSSRK